MYTLKVARPCGAPYYMWLVRLAHGRCQKKSKLFEAVCCLRTDFLIAVNLSRVFEER